MIARLSALGAALLLAACSRDYAPDDKADGARIYRDACQECHKPAANGSIFILQAEHANTAYIAAKVKNGSGLMPAFPGLKTDALHKISLYALEHSDTAE
ncbi:MAG: cytochrome c [Methylococcales bacterium]|nr:cytochrome c [Methylococcales bacterium]